MLEFDPAQYFEPMLPRPAHLAPAGRLRHPIKALLCDIYGTLIISGSGDIGINHSSDETGRFGKLLHKYGINLSQGELQQRLRDAISADHERERARGIDFPEVMIERIWMEILPLNNAKAARQFAAEYELITNPVWPMPHLADFLAAGRRAGIHLGIISNAQFYTPLLFEWLLGSDLGALGFDPDLTIFSFQEGRAKPSSLLFDEARRRLESRGVAPECCAYIGNDMRNDIRPAARQGFQTILFAGDTRSLRLRENEIDATVKPDRIITDLIELIGDLYPIS